MSHRKDGQTGVYKVGRTECVYPYCDKRGHVDEFAFCLTCGSHVCPEHMETHEKSISHVVSWSLSKRYNWRATVEYLNKKVVVKNGETFKAKWKVTVTEDGIINEPALFKKVKN